MYAIIRAGGHQERVEAGDRILIDRVKTEVGGTLEFAPLLVSVEGEAVSNRAQLKEKAGVTGTVIEHVRGDKVDVFMYRQKTGYRRHTGHRQPMTLLEIAEIRLGGEVFTAPEPAPEEPKTDGAEEKPAKKAAAKKPAAKKK